MSLKEIKQAVDDNALPLAVAEKYLKLYVADINWQPHIASLWKNASNKFSDQNQAKEYMKKALSCAILLPMVEKTPIPDPPHNLLFWCTGWKQFNSYDWFDMLISVIKEDITIFENRNKSLGIGIIDPIDISPLTRQAFNWIFEKDRKSTRLNSSHT